MVLTFDWNRILIKYGRVSGTGLLTCQSFIIHFISHAHLLGVVAELTFRLRRGVGTSDQSFIEGCDKVSTLFLFLLAIFDIDELLDN